MLKRIYSSLKKTLKPLPLSFVMCIIGAVAIYYLGERIGARGFRPFKTDEIRFWVSLGLLGLASILLLIMIGRWIMVWRSNRARKEARKQTQEELEILAMDQVFQHAVSVIQNRWAGTGRGIYNLPWYLIIGKKNVGKTSIIENGELRFPIDHEIRAEITTIGDFEACSFADWRVSGTEAVLLELAGEFFIPHEERTSVQKVVWDRFLTNLQKIRPRRPINGIVLAIDLPEFCGYTFAEREAYAGLVRRTVNDLVERLGTQLTVHVMFTKLDQMAGFADYFENLSAIERENLFGFHFLYEGQHTQAWLDQFTQQYDEFLDRLNLQVKRRLLSLKHRRSRQEAFTFYRAFLGLQAPLKSFLNSALTPDKFSTPPLVRGLYFVSNCQENAPKNIFLEAIGHRYALPKPLYGTSQSASFPYFITPFFKKALFPEAGLAGNNQRVERLYKKRITIAAVSVLVACIGGGFYWNAKYNQNLGKAEAVLDKARLFVDLEPEQTSDPTGYPLLEPLNTIRAATFEFGDYRKVGSVVGQVSLYKGNQVGPLADEAYRTVLNKSFAPVLIDGIADKLRTTCPKGSDTELEYLRVYRMMGELAGRDNRVIEKYFGNLWQHSFEARAETQNQLDEHLDYMLNVVPQDYELDKSVVIEAQNNLGRLTPFRRVYSALRSDADRQLPNPIEFPSSIGATFGIVYTDGEVVESTQAVSNNGTSENKNACGQIVETAFERDPFEIPRLFTAAEFKDFFVPQNEKVAEVAAKDLWVLGQLETTEYSEADFQYIREKVLEIYTDEYIRIWRKSLNAMQVNDFEDIRGATEILRALSGPENPIRRVAQLVADNTKIYEPEGEVLEGNEAIEQQNELPIDSNRQAGLTIYDSFGQIRRMLEDKPEGGQPSIEQIEEALTALYDYMKTIRDAPEPNAKALEVAIKRAELTGEDPIYVLQRIAERAPAPFNDHLRNVADQAWRIVMIGATEELNRKWHDEIFGDYQRLIAGKYPFNRASDVDLPVEDFEEFFRPDGILETFYNKELLVFIDKASGRPRVIDNQSLAVDPRFAKTLSDAIDITKSFFDASGELSVEFKVQTVGMSANLARAVLNIEGQVVINSHGPSKTVSIIWPNIVDQPVSSYIDISPLHGTGKSIRRQFDGVWSWLRLYDSAAKSNFQNNSVDISFGNANKQSATFRFRPEARINPFFNSPLSEFSLPSHLRNGGS